MPWAIATLMEWPRPSGKGKYTEVEMPEYSLVIALHVKLDCEAQDNDERLLLLAEAAAGFLDNCVQLRDAFTLEEIINAARWE